SPRWSSPEPPDHDPPVASPRDDRQGGDVIERRTELTTEDGTMTTFVVHPSEGGPHPVVLMLMDAPSIRPALHDMASRLATAGYYVMLPFLFYRGSEFREFGQSDEDMHA